MVRIVVFISAFVLAANCNLAAEEITLFNKNGEPIAYIDADDEGLTIYLWNGTAVAYLETNKNVGFDIYGYNGRHLGWYENGIVIDHDGYAVGFIEGATSVFTKLEPVKPYKKFKPFRDFKEFAPFKPFYQNRFSNQPLSLFLLEGAK